MNSFQWFEILKKAIKQTKIEVNNSQITDMFLVFEEDKLNYFSPYINTIDQQNYMKLSQTWKILVQILKNELQLNSWKKISIHGLKKILTIYSFKNDSLSIFFSIIHDSNFDPIEILKIFLKYIFIEAFREKYETVGLIASEGYPIWVIFPENKKMDDFLFAISVTSLLSLVERIDMEVSAGGVVSCIIQGNENILLHVSFNPTQDIALAVTQQGKKIEELSLDPELISIFENISDPILLHVNILEYVDPDREGILEEIRQEFGGETTDEEIQTLNMFDTETLNFLENEIKKLAKKYSASEISLGYLRKRMRLPREVLSISLEYLISNKRILGRIGKERHSGREILLLDFSVERSQEEMERVSIVKRQIEDLFLPLNPFLEQIPLIEETPIEMQEEISEVLSEFQVILALSDTDPLFLLKNDLTITTSQFENSVKGLILIKNRLSEINENDLIYSELKERYSSLEIKNIEQQKTIIGKTKKFLDDLINSYRFLLKLIPIPSEFKNTDKGDEITIIISCSAYKCETRTVLKSKPEFWVKISLFSIIIGITDNFPNENIPQVKKLKENYESIYQELISLVKDTEIKTKISYYSFLEKLDELLITNKERDDIITKLRLCYSHIDKEINDFYSLFFQCKSCQRWYCKHNKKHMSKDSKCIYC